MVEIIESIITMCIPLVIFVLFVRFMRANKRVAWKEFYPADLDKPIKKKSKFWLIMTVILMLPLIYATITGGGFYSQANSDFKFIQDQASALKSSDNKENPDYSSANVFSVIKPAENKTTFADVIGCSEAKKKLAMVVSYIHNPVKYKKLNAKQPRGIILYGAPGTGKTLLARAIAGEAQVNVIATSGTVFIEQWVGLGAKRVRDLFSLARKNKPCIIFIDEFEAVVPSRQQTGMSGGNSEYNATVNQFLSELDGFNKDDMDEIYIIAATNHLNKIDEAVIRSGRFNHQILVSLPNIDERAAIFKLYAQKTQVLDVDFDYLALHTQGYSGADIESLVQEAIYNAVNANRDHVTQEDFLQALHLP